MSHDEGRVCPCVADHRPAVMELHRHHVRPLAMGGSDTPSNVVHICPTSHVGTHEVLRFALAGQTTFPGATRYARTLALEGLARWRAGTHGIEV